MSSPHYEDSINHVNSNTTISGLPDGLFPNQKSHFGYTQEVLAVEDVGTFYDQVAYFTTIWWIFWPFATMLRLNGYLSVKSNDSFLRF
jgi:hypothetical protein